jgi:hypothetical protein
MKPSRLPFRIEIARWDPARGQIAGDISLRGGSPVPGESLVYTFRSAEYRDRILRELHGCYGSYCAFARDAADLAGLTS